MFIVIFDNISASFFIEVWKGINELDILFDSCLAMLDCKLSDFPFGINTKKFNRIIDITNLIDFSSPDASIFIEFVANILYNKKPIKFDFIKLYRFFMYVDILD